MQRRKFIAGLGSLAAGSAAVLGTGAYEGAYIHGDRDLSIGVESDNNAYLSLIASSPFASYERSDGGWERGNGGKELKVEFERLNANMDSRFDDVFRVRNTTGKEVSLKIEDGPDWNGASQWEDAFQVHVEDSNGNMTRLDDGGYVTLGAGEEVSVNIFILLDQYDPNGHEGMQTLSFTADGTTA